MATKMKTHSRALAMGLAFAGLATAAISMGWIWSRLVSTEYLSRARRRVSSLFFSSWGSLGSSVWRPNVLRSALARHGSVRAGDDVHHQRSVAHGSRDGAHRVIGGFERHGPVAAHERRCRSEADQASGRRRSTHRPAGVTSDAHDREVRRQAGAGAARMPAGVVRAANRTRDGPGVARSEFALSPCR